MASRCWRSLGIFLATPLLYYATANPSMSHGVQAAAGTAFVLAWLWAREADDRRRWLLTGLLGGLVCVIRPQDAVLLALPLLDLLRRGRGALPRGSRVPGRSRGARCCCSWPSGCSCTGSRSRT